MELKTGKNRFFLVDELQHEIGEVTYAPTGDDTLIIDHTFVSEQYRGQHLAEELVERVVKFARDEHKKIIPLCPFAKAEFEKKPEYHDVLFEN